MKPLVSLGLPVFNGENYLREAIESVLAQDYSNWELLIFDNASEDATEAIAREFAESDERIHYFRQAENLGAVPNFNQTFEASSGQYFKWFAHDDRLRSDYLSRCIEVLETEPSVSLCHSWVEVLETEASRSKGDRTSLTPTPIFSGKDWAPLCITTESVTIFSALCGARS